jgi:hypothetical protein
LPLSFRPVAVGVAVLVMVDGCGPSWARLPFAGPGDSGTREGASEPIGDDDGSTPNCPLVCPESEFAMLDLTCPAVVTSAQLTGPCAPASDASLSDAEPFESGGGTAPSAFGGSGFWCSMARLVPFTQCTQIYLIATEPGICHVALTFADGFTYSTDVTFTWMTLGAAPGCPDPCRPFVGPTQVRFLVDNPSATCIDGGVDGG